VMRPALIIVPLRQAKPGRGGSMSTFSKHAETSYCEPAGESPDPERTGHPPEPSGAGAIPPAKRTQEACRLCDRAP
jgi:hypothetical protein